MYCQKQTLIHSLILLCPIVTLGHAMSNETNCSSVQDEDKSDCGHFQITPKTCREHQCMYCPSDKQGVPWCFMTKANLYNCSTFVNFTKIDCLPTGKAYKGRCEAAGCYWCASPTRGVPWCFKDPRITNATTVHQTITSTTSNYNRTSSANFTVVLSGSTPNVMTSTNITSPNSNFSSTTYSPSFISKNMTSSTYATSNVSQSNSSSSSSFSSTASSVSNNFSTTKYVPSFSKNKNMTSLPYTISNVSMYVSTSNSSSALSYSSTPKVITSSINFSTTPYSPHTITRNSSVRSSLSAFSSTRDKTILQKRNTSFSIVTSRVLTASTSPERKSKSSTPSTLPRRTQSALLQNSSCFELTIAIPVTIVCTLAFAGIIVFIIYMFRTRRLRLGMMSYNTYTQHKNETFDMD